MLITAEGQLAIGDTIEITGKSERDSQVISVKDVITVNGHEEIIINKKRNYYFITQLLIEGKSWAKQVIKR